MKQLATIRKCAVLGGILLGSVARAQAPDTDYTPPVVSYLTADGRRASPQDSAAYCAETFYRDSLTAFTRVYYPEGPLFQFIPYEDVRRNKLYGRYSSWYANGQLRSMVDYDGGVRQGDLVTYYPTGILKRREHYVNGRSGLGQCYDASGHPVPYFIFEQLPLYPGGNEMLVLELTRALRLNADEERAMRHETNNVELLLHDGFIRRVEVELVVAPDGEIADARVAQSNAAYLNQAALRAVAQLRRRFIPGQRDGELVTTYLTVPLEYNLARHTQVRSSAYPRR